MLGKVKKLITPIALGASALLYPAVALAQNNEIVPNQIKPINDILPVIQAIIRFILIVAFIIAFIMLLVGGIRWIIASGDEKAVAGARNTITAALIGLVIVLVAYAIIRLVETFFSVNIITGGVNIPRVGGP